MLVDSSSVDVCIQTNSKIIITEKEKLNKITFSMYLIFSIMSIFYPFQHNQTIKQSFLN